MKVVAVGLAVLLAAACEPEPAETESTEPELVALPGPRPAGQVRERTLLVLVNTPEAVYRVDPDTLEVTLLGRFSFRDGPTDQITDITLDRRGRMWGLGFEAVYRIDPDTFECTRLARHPGRALNALSIMTSSILHREAPDIMIAAEFGTQAIYQVDPGTGALNEIGDLGGTLSSSGDLTWAPGVGAIMITTGPGGYEGISRLLPDTFAAEPIGGGWTFSKVRGLTMLPHGLLLGVSERGEMIEIDPRTGNASLRVTHPLVFYGGAIGWE